MRAYAEQDAADFRAATSACMADPAPVVDTAPWPAALGDSAFEGISGEIVRAILPHTEADPAALLVQFLIGFGSTVGRAPFYRVGADFHRLNLFGILVGPTSKGRKGSAWNAIKHVLEAADSEWADKRNTSGLSTGEGIIWAVRDAIEEREAIRDPKTKRVTDYQNVITDTGVDDKRLMVVETEFASALRVGERDGNTLTAVLRQAWDSGTLRILTRKSPAKATGAHISVVGHITKDELLRYLSSTESGNGFGNRFLWVCVRRSKLLPDGGQLGSVDFAPILRRLNDAIRFARTAAEMTRDDEARDLWHDVYPQLTRDRPGLFGAVTGRAEAITLRLSLLYALLDRSAVIRVPHLAAALEVWRYCEDSARFIFGDALGDATADSILVALRAQPEGMTRTEISVLFDRHRSTQQINRALGVLETLGFARSEREETGGRPTERWFAR